MIFRWYVSPHERVFFRVYPDEKVPTLIPKLVSLDERVFMHGWEYSTKPNGKIHCPIIIDKRIDKVWRSPNCNGIYLENNKHTIELLKEKYVRELMSISGKEWLPNYDPSGPYVIEAPFSEPVHEPASEASKSVSQPLEPTPTITVVEEKPIIESQRTMIEKKPFVAPIIKTKFKSARKVVTNVSPPTITLKNTFSSLPSIPEIPRKKKSKASPTTPLPETAAAADVNRQKKKLQHKREIRQAARKRKQERDRLIKEEKKLHVRAHVSPPPTIELKPKPPILPCSFDMDPTFLLALSDFIFPIHLIPMIRDTFDYIYSTVRMYTIAARPSERFNDIYNRDISDDFLAVLSNHFNQSFERETTFESFMEAYRDFSRSQLSMEQCFFYLQDVLKLQPHSCSAVLLRFIQELYRDCERLHASAENACWILAAPLQVKRLETLHRGVIGHLNNNFKPHFSPNDWNVKQTLEYFFSQETPDSKCATHCVCQERFCIVHLYERWINIHTMFQLSHMVVYWKCKEYAEKILNNYIEKLKAHSNKK